MRIYGREPTPEHIDLIKRTAAKARATRAALCRLTETEYMVIEGLYFGAPCPVEVLCRKLGCEKEELAGLEKKALESFCTYMGIK